MMQLITPIILVLLSATVTMVITPVLRKLALATNHVDVPNFRKTHRNAIPLVGGVSIAFGAFCTVLLSSFSIAYSNQVLFIGIGALTLLFVGVLDDRMDVRASLKLAIQLLLAHFAFVNGIQLNSLHGMFGITELPIELAYPLTIVLIAGVINAFNLIDGIDGLAAGLSIIGISVLVSISFVINKPDLAFALLAVLGGLVSFLKFNFSKNKKVFMGDAGSLFIGFIVVCSALILVENSSGTANELWIVSTVVGILFFPVFDSLRVYRKRLKNGKSPLKADRTHFHHLILTLGWKHKKATFIISIMVISFVTIGFLSGSMVGVSFSFFCLLISFWIVTSFVEFANQLNYWKKTIKELEKDN